MIDITKKHTARNGTEVTLVSDKGRGRYPIVGYIGDSDTLQCWTSEGVYHIDAGLHSFDLVEVKEKKVAYFNTYPEDRTWLNSTRDIADKNADKTRIACIRIEYEEGQFDE
jgi:hypothetical protein